MPIVLGAVTGVVIGLLLIVIFLNKSVETLETDVSILKREVSKLEVYKTEEKYPLGRPSESYVEFVERVRKGKFPYETLDGFQMKIGDVWFDEKDIKMALQDNYERILQEQKDLATDLSSKNKED